MSQEWSRVVSAEVKKEYMTLQGIQTHCSQLTSQNTKTVKSHLSLTLMRVKLVTLGITLNLGTWGCITSNLKSFNSTGNDYCLFMVSSSLD